MNLSNVFLYLLNFLKNNLGKLSIIIGLAIGLFVIVFSFLFGINQYGIGFAIFGASLFYLVLPHSLKTTQYYNLFIEFNITKKYILDITYFCIYCISLIIIYFDQYHRSIIYFILLSLLATLIVIDILSKDKFWFFLIVFKIFLLALNIRYGIFFEFNGLSGGDIWTHAKMISNSLDVGAITATSMEYSKYFYYPILHLLVSILCLVAYIPLKISIFYSVIVTNILTSLILFKIGQLVGRERISLFAILIYLISDIPILKTSLHIEPLTIIVIYFCLILWLLIKQKKIEHTIIITILYISMVLTHQLGTLVSLFITIVFLSSLWLYEYFSRTCSYHRKLKNYNFFLLLFMCILLILYWQYSYVAYGSNISFFEFSVQPFSNVLKYGWGGDLDSLAYIKVLTSYNFLSNILFQLGYFILLFFVVFGILYWLNDITPYRFGIISVIVGLYLVIWGLPLTKFGNSGMFTRWLIFTYIFMIFPAADAIILISSQMHLKFRKNDPSKYFPLLIIFLLCFTMITTPYINGDSPIHSKDRWPRSMFRDTELVAVDTISRIYSDPIITDAYYPVVFTMSSFAADFHTIELDSEKENEFALLLRTCAINEPVGIKSYGYELGMTKVIGPAFFDKTNYNSNLSCVYNNDKIIFYIPFQQ